MKGVSFSFIKSKVNENNKHILSLAKTFNTPNQPIKVYPRGSCSYRNIKYLNFSDLIEPDTNLYFYSPCICEYTSEYYRLFYRVSTKTKWRNDKIATCLLTKELNVVVGTNKYLSLHSVAKESEVKTSENVRNMLPKTYFTFKDGEHVEDPRAVIFNNAWFLLYTDGVHMGIAKLELDTCDTIYSHYLEKPENSNHLESDGREKNWIPFVAEDKLYILYSDIPRTIVTCIDSIDKLEYSDVNISDEITSWDYGAVRGGAPPCEYDKDTLIWFFHSQSTYPSYFRQNNVNVYMAGYYLTTNVFPYKVVAISKIPLIVGIPSNYVKDMFFADCVAFAMGCVKISSGWRLSVHLNDCEIGILDVSESDFIWKKSLNN